MIKLRHANGPSHWKVGVGVGIAALLVYAIANAGEDKVRFINIDGKTIRVTKLGNGRFEMGTWGVLLGTAASSDPLATVLMGQDGVINAQGVPDLIDYLRTAMRKIPDDLFRVDCSVPGCFINNGKITKGSV